MINKKSVSIYSLSTHPAIPRCRVQKWTKPGNRKYINGRPEFSKRHVRSLAKVLYQVWSGYDVGVKQYGKKRSAIYCNMADPYCNTYCNMLYMTFRIPDHV